MANIGDKVKWVSSYKEKEGTVIGVLAKEESAREFIANRLNKSEKYEVNLPKLSNDRSVHDRYVVEVPRGGKSTLTDFYFPMRSVVDRCMKGR